MSVTSTSKAQANSDRRPANVIFDFDLTLFPEESLLGVAKAAIRSHGKHEKLRESLEHHGSRKKTFRSGVKDLFSLLTVFLSIKKSVISDYHEQSSSKLDPVFFTLIKRLQEMNVRVYIITSGYREVVSRLAGSLGIHAQDIAANEFAWWRENAILVKPSPLHRAHGKIRIIERWQASGKLEGPFIMVGDGQADRNVFERGLAHGFIQANYYRPTASHSLSGNFQVAETTQQLPMILYSMIEEMRQSGNPSRMH